jgi:hypothetical protein
MRSAAVPVTLAALLLLPSANLHRFDGLPLGSLPEAAALALLVPLLVSRALRRLLARLLGAWPAALRRGLLWAGAAALGAKLLLLVGGAHAGFLACYSTPLSAPPAGPCERAFENPFFRFGVTRLDPVVDFGPETWDLSFVNSSRFNYYHWLPGRPIRSRLPLGGAWTGTLATGRPREAEVLYVGAGSIQVGADLRVELPAHYGSAPRDLRFAVPPGRHAIRITYAFDDGLRSRERRRPGAYATLRLRWADRPGAPAIRPDRPAASWRALGRAVDAVVVALVLPIVAFHAWLLRREWWVAGVAVLLGLAGPVPRAAPGWLQPALWTVPLAWLVLARTLARPRSRGLLLAFFAFAALLTAIAIGQYGRLGRMTIRSAGSDWLTYESLARRILETWSLEGGEPVFGYQPLFRYLRFAQRLLLGDGDALLLAAGLTALTWAVLWAAARLRPRRGAPAAWRLLAGVAAGCLLVAALSRPVVRLVAASASEHPTWILLPLVVPALLAARARRRWLWGTLGLGAGFLFRTNHLPAVVGLFGAFALRIGRRHPQTLGVATALLGACLVLPAAHNAYYGRVWVPLTRMATIPQTLVLPPARLFRDWDDGRTWRALGSQLRGIAALTGDLDPALRAALHGLQLAWLGAGLALLATGRGDRVTGLAWLVPGLYLGVHVFYRVWTYYPRHVLAGHVAMGLVTLVAARRLADGPAPPDPAGRPGEPPGPVPARPDAPGGRCQPC